MHKDIEEVLITQKQLQKKVEELGRQITRDYEGRTMLLLCVLKGALMFMADLARAIDLPLEMDFMVVSSYGSATESSGVVRIVKDLEKPIAGKDVLLVEDIVDSGLTLHYLLDVLRTRSPASLRVCTLIDKVKERDKIVTPDYMAFRLLIVLLLAMGLITRSIIATCLISGYSNRQSIRMNWMDLTPQAKIDKTCWNMI